MKNRVIGIPIALLLMLSLNAPSTVSAVSDMPAAIYHQHVPGTVMQEGEIVYLFHSGIEQVKSTIHPGDTLPVYRITSLCEVKLVGKITVISYVGETYLKGEVIEGEIRANDVAKIGKVSCLVINASPCYMKP
jgi:hypothetical protein